MKCRSLSNGYMTISTLSIYRQHLYCYWLRKTSLCDKFFGNFFKSHYSVPCYRPWIPNATCISDQSLQFQGLRRMSVPCSPDASLLAVSMVAIGSSSQCLPLFSRLVIETWYDSSRRGDLCYIYGLPVRYWMTAWEAIVQHSVYLIARGDFLPFILVK